LALTFKKNERLCSRKQIEVLFGKGLSMNAYPIKLVFMDAGVDAQFPSQAMFVVPKRNFKKAHDRNKLKRRMRESFRLNKHNLYEYLNNENKKLVFSFIYTSKKPEMYSQINLAVEKLLQKIMK
jgi:ribonuclease P protein component